MPAVPPICLPLLTDQRMRQDRSSPRRITLVLPNTITELLSHGPGPGRTGDEHTVGATVDIGKYSSLQRPFSFILQCDIYCIVLQYQTLLAV